MDRIRTYKTIQVILLFASQNRESVQARSYVVEHIVGQHFMNYSKSTINLNHAI